MKPLVLYNRKTRSITLVFPPSMEAVAKMCIVFAAHVTGHRHYGEEIVRTLRERMQ